MRAPLSSPRLGWTSARISRWQVSEMLRHFELALPGDEALSAPAGGYQVSTLRPAELLAEGSDNDPARTALVEWRHSGGGDVTSVVGCGEHFGSADAAALAGLGPTFAELPSQSALVAALLQARPHPRHFLDTS